MRAGSIFGERFQEARGTGTARQGRRGTSAGCIREQVAPVGTGARSCLDSLGDRTGPGHVPSHPRGEGAGHVPTHSHLPLITGLLELSSSTHRPRLLLPRGGVAGAEQRGNWPLRKYDFGSISCRQGCGGSPKGAGARGWSRVGPEGCRGSCPEAWPALPLLIIVGAVGRETQV